MLTILITFASSDCFALLDQKWSCCEHALEHLDSGTKISITRVIIANNET